jgi:glycosyltransferase involved in cell wall biosynthesis
MANNTGARPRVVILGPSLTAVSGVSTHVNMLLGSKLGQQFALSHFRVGSEGRKEGTFGRLARFLLSPMQLGAFLVRSRADLVHLNTSLDMKAYWRDLGYLMVAKLLRRRVVNQVHGGPNPPDFFPRSRLLTWILRQFLVRSEAVTVLSRQELNAYAAFDARIKIHLVPNAIDPTGLIDEPRAENLDGPLRLVYVGRIVDSKGIFETLTALKLLRSQGRRFTFQIAGAGRDEERLRQMVEEEGLSDCTQLLGPVFGPSKNRLWLESDAFVFPTRHAEGLPYSLLESMAAACVAIISPVAAIPDVVQSEVQGFLVPPCDPQRLSEVVARLDDDRALLQRVAQAGRERVREGYTTQRLADDFAAIYRGVLRADGLQVQ